jgi:hypothetical protein
MNFLLRELKRDGTMRHDCIAFNEPHLVPVMMERAPGRAIMHMGESVRPGPYWAVHAEDVTALELAGYKVHRPAE